VTADAVVVLCTAPAAGSGGKPGAEALARQLVDERLCACGNVVPGVRSFFRWEGKVDTADECLLIAKTTAAVCAVLRARIVQLHPYEVPEVLELAVDGGLPAYLRWLADATAPAR
jgi:periplasmic divalent cation tolerance protein